MTTFSFAAVRADGIRVRGRLDAVNAAAAAAEVSRRGLYPIDVAEDSTRVVLWQRASARALAAPVEALAMLVNAGVPLAAALRVVSNSCSGALAPCFRRIETAVREGVSLATAFEGEAATFPTDIVGLVRSGERGAGLGAAVTEAAKLLERRAETQARVRAALAYPAVLGVVGLVATGFILLVVVPRFAALLADLGTSVPASTRVIVGAGLLLRGHPLLVTAALLLLGVALLALWRANRAAWNRVLLQVPVVGRIRFGFATARTAQTLGTLLGAGVTAHEALGLASAAADDSELSARLDRARGRVLEGACVVESLDLEGAVTEATVQLARIGESGGQLAELLLRAAELERRQAERRMGVLVSLIEPVLILVFAGLVALVTAALLQAVYSVRPAAL